MIASRPSIDRLLVAGDVPEPGRARRLRSMLLGRKATRRIVIAMYRHPAPPPGGGFDTTGIFRLHEAGLVETLFASVGIAAGVVLDPKISHLRFITLDRCLLPDARLGSLLDTPSAHQLLKLRNHPQVQLSCTETAP